MIRDLNARKLSAKSSCFQSNSGSLVDMMNAVMAESLLSVGDNGGCCDPVHFVLQLSLGQTGFSRCYRRLPVIAATM